MGKEQAATAERMGRYRKRLAERVGPPSTDAMNRLQGMRESLIPGSGKLQLFKVSYGGIDYADVPTQLKMLDKMYQDVSGQNVTLTSEFPEVALSFEELSQKPFDDPDFRGNATERLTLAIDRFLTPPDSSPLPVEGK